MLKTGGFGQSVQETPKFSVTELSVVLREFLEGSFNFIQVEGEISNLSRPRSGHIYFTLKEGDAQIQAAWFRGRQQSASAESIRDGMQVEVSCTITFYGGRGSCQLLVHDIKESGKGRQAQALKELKTRLENEGLFDRDRKKKLPFIPKRLGVVTSPHGAAIHDILQVLRRRFPAADVLIYPVPVQGEPAAALIAQAILQASIDPLCDLLIVGRGGGSEEDLWAFNEEVVVRAIAACEIPIISAVGHEVDTVLSDLVADRRALTPTEAAELAYPDSQDLQMELNSLGTRLKHLVQQCVASQKRELSHFKKHPSLSSPIRIVERHGQMLDDFEERMQRILHPQHLERARRDLQDLWRQLRFASSHLQKQTRDHLSHLQNRFQRNWQLCWSPRPETILAELHLELQGKMLNILTHKRKDIEAHHSHLASCSPLKSAARGFPPVLLANGQLLKDSSDIQPGDLLWIQQLSRKMQTRIESIHPLK